MRNPIDAVASFWKWYLEYNQVWKGKLHRSNPPERFFRDYPEWNTFVERKSLLWVKLVEFDFLSYSMNPVLLVRYEDLKENATREVKNCHCNLLCHTLTLLKKLLCKS